MQHHATLVWICLDQIFGEQLLFHLCQAHSSPHLMRAAAPTLISGPPHHSSTRGVFAARLGVHIPTPDNAGAPSNHCFTGRPGFGPLGCLETICRMCVFGGLLLGGW